MSDGKKTQKRTYKRKTYRKKNIIAKDVKKEVSKQLSNIVEKRVYRLITKHELGQYKYDGTNYQSCHAIGNPVPATKVGAAELDRIGKKLTLSSIKINLHAINTSLQSAPVRFKTYVVQVKTGYQYDNTSLFMADFLYGNTMINDLNIGVVSEPIYDYFSMRNTPLMYKFKVLKSKTWTMHGDTVTGQNQQGETSFGLKNINLKLRYDSDSTTIRVDPSEGQLLVLTVCDRGNFGPNNGSLDSVVDNTAGTGYYLYHSYQVYVTDN